MLRLSLDLSSANSRYFSALGKGNRSIHHQGVAFGGLGGGGRNPLPEQVPDVSAQSFIGWPVARVIDVMLQIVEQLVAGRVTLVNVADERAVQDLDQPIVHPLVP